MLILFNTVYLLNKKRAFKPDFSLSSCLNFINSSGYFIYSFSTSYFEGLDIKNKMLAKKNFQKRRTGNLITLFMHIL